MEITHDFIIIISLFIVTTALFITELSGKTGIVDHILNYSSCDRNNQVKTFILVICYVTILAGLIHMYGVIISPTVKKKFNLVNFMGDGQVPVIGPFGSWALTHIFFHSVLGYLCPKNFLLFFTMGVLFEVFELCMGKVSHSPLLSNYWTTGRYGFNYMDIVANTLGFGIGATLNKLSK